MHFGKSSYIIVASLPSLREIKYLCDPSCGCKMQSSPLIKGKTIYDDWIDSPKFDLFSRNGCHFTMVELPCNSTLVSRDQCLNTHRNVTNLATLQGIILDCCHHNKLSFSTEVINKPFAF